ncbi:MAG: C1 family peptidase [Spirochaetia bacterium]|nr:C1 family peptidase [Spirochaetia bacterium]
MRTFIEVGCLLLFLVIGGCAVPGAFEPTADHPFPTGALKDSEEVMSANAETEAEAPVLSAAALPAQVDLSSNFPPVGNQGNQGSCVGWATGYALKTCQEEREEGWNASLKEHEFSPSWVYNQINGGQDQGALISDALALIVKKGADTLNHFSYSDSDYRKKPDPNSFARAAHFRASRWASLLNDAAKIKKYLSQGKALVIGIDVYQEFMSLSPARPVYDSIRSGKNYGGHALCVVGYDDSRKAFKVINSWGKTWGVNGYGFISYSFFIKNSPIGLQAYILYDKKNT